MPAWRFSCLLSWGMAAPICAFKLIGNPFARVQVSLKAADCMFKAVPRKVGSAVPGVYDSLPEFLNLMRSGKQQV